MDRVVNLEPRQTMQQKRAEQLLHDDAIQVGNLIARKPGIASRAVIADELGMTEARVKAATDHIQDPQSSFAWIEYGRSTARGGPFAGELRDGWWPLKLAVHQEVLGQADRHSSLTERGVRMSRLVRKLAAEGMTTLAAEAQVAQIEDRLGEDIGLMSAADLDAFEDILLAEVSG